MTLGHQSSLRWLPLLGAVLLMAETGLGQGSDPSPVSWVNPKLPEGPGLSHQVLESKAMGNDVGYLNPIGGSLTMGDPFVLVDAHRLFLYGTTAVSEGFRCWSSTNFTDWTERGFAYRKTANSWGAKTFWAPEVIRYRDRYYLVFSCEPATNEGFSARICLVVSDRPEGPFREFRSPLFDNGWSCIDGHIFVDTDGKAYLFFAKVGVVQAGAKRYLSGVIYVVS